MSTKEEQKQHLIDIMERDEELGLYELGQLVHPNVQLEESKEEIIEEAADLWAIDTNNVHPADSYIAKTSFIQGAKWQAQRMFTEEDMRKAFKIGHQCARQGSYNDITEQEDYDKWKELGCPINFEQLKKREVYHQRRTL